MWLNVNDGVVSIVDNSMDMDGMDVTEAWQGGEREKERGRERF